MPISKNHRARLRRVDQRLDQGIDALMRANGELWPRELRPYSERVQAAVEDLQSLSREIAERLADSDAANEPEPAEVDPNQEDVEDVDGVEQPQPEPVPMPAAQAEGRTTRPARRVA